MALKVLVASHVTRGYFVFGERADLVVERTTPPLQHFCCPSDFECMKTLLYQIPYPVFDLSHTVFPILRIFDLFMSTAPHSPPQTPLKPTMAVEKENLQSPDIPLNNDAHRPPAETPSKATKQTRSSPEVQVLCSLPHNDHGDRPVNNAVHQPEQIRSDPSDAQTEVTEDHPEPETEDIEPDYNTKLPDMDWADFENRYDEAIAKASKEEQDLLAEFEKYAEVR